MFQTTVFMSTLRDEYFFVTPETEKIPGFCRLRYYFQSEESVRTDFGKLNFKEIEHESARKPDHEKLLPKTVQLSVGKVTPEDRPKNAEQSPQSAIDLDNI
jgi:hypothetical protein